MRRKNLNEEEVSKMKEQEGQGMPRAEIARFHGCTAACVTRKLGAKRPYRQLRRQEAQPQ
jgi:DNA invertase Pin-like site-specific DNA recombinase